MLVAENRDIGVVVDHDELRPPADRHRKSGGEDEIDEELEVVGPLRARAERRRGPIFFSHAPLHLARVCPGPAGRLAARTFSLDCHRPPAGHAKTGFNVRYGLLFRAAVARFRYLHLALHAARRSPPRGSFTLPKAPSPKRHARTALPAARR